MHGGKPSGEHSDNKARSCLKEKGELLGGTLKGRAVGLSLRAFSELRDVEDATSSARSGQAAPQQRRGARGAER